MALKLEQGQVWKHGDEFIRIVHLTRLEVGYKVVKHLKSRAGTHQHTSKKDFCRLLKSATLLRAQAGVIKSGWTEISGQAPRGGTRPTGTGKFEVVGRVPHKH